MAAVAVMVACLLYAVGLIRRRVRPGSAQREAPFTAGILVVAVALVSPLDTAATALASAHMVQHLLLVLVAAPLLALSEPDATLLREHRPGSADVSVGSKPRPGCGDR